jgi:glutamate 5-kinase
MRWGDIKLLVVKIGSSLMMGEDGLPRRDWMHSVAQDIALLREDGTRVILVCSGAVALGGKPMGLPVGALELQQKQAAAACGQPLLMQHWQQAFAPLGIDTAQILLTLKDTEERRSYLNARNTFSALLEAGVVPIVNENDTTATAELRYGDNDRLAARVVQLAGAGALILLSDVEGLYDSDPRQNPNAKRIAEVKHITPEIEAMAGGAGSAIGSGGMRTKIAAAKIATGSGGHVAICNGHAMHPLQHLREGGDATWFIATESPVAARKRWIAGSLNPGGSVFIDTGAAKALLEGRSLLPAGVTRIEGEFGKGETLAVIDTEGRTLAKGLSNYDAADARKIMGKRRDEIPKSLGYDGPNELIHRDNLVMEVRP